MDDDAKKTALRMIPYGIYVMTAENDGEVAAATVNWVTQTSFAPPLVVVGAKADSGAYTIAKAAQRRFDEDVELLGLIQVAGELSGERGNAVAWR